MKLEKKKETKTDEMPTSYGLEETIKKHPKRWGKSNSIKIHRFLDNEIIDDDFILRKNKKGKLLKIKKKKDEAFRSCVRFEIEKLINHRRTYANNVSPFKQKDKKDKGTGTENE